MAPRRREVPEGDSDQVIENIAVVADKLSEQVDQLKDFVSQLKKGRPGFEDGDPLRSTG